MNDELLQYYEGELLFIRELAKDFAKQYPAAAGRLLLEQGRSVDPHVERLIESFALLTARIRHKIDDEFPELTDALLGVLYPHFLAPVPSMAMLQFDLDMVRSKPPNGLEVKAGSMLHTQRVGDVACKYRTCYPVQLWPIAVAEAKFQPPPFPQGLNAPARAVAALRIRFETPAETPFSKLSLNRLRLYFHGDQALISPLYGILFANCLQVAIRIPDAKPPVPPILLEPNQCVFPVGFEADQGLLPYPRQSFLGYRLLTEFFSFPLKFHFMDLGGWDRVRAAGAGRQVEVVFFLSRTLNRLEQLLDKSFIRLGATPVANLFEHTCEPIPLHHRKPEYRVVPEVSQPAGYEVYQIQSVVGASPAGDREFHPFYSYRHGSGRTAKSTFWNMTRRPSLREADRGTDVYLSLVDLHFDIHQPAETNLIVKALCTNRDLPSKLPRSGEEVKFEPEFVAPIRVICLRNPTGSLRPPVRRGAYWRLMSHLNLNHLSLGDEVEGLPALQEILRLYDFSDPMTDAQLSAVTRQMIDGIVGLKSRKIVGRVGGSVAGGFARGVEVALEFDEQKYAGSNLLLFASVLERFLGQYVSVNSFTQLVAKSRQGEGEFKRWPPRAGEQPLL